MTHDKVRNRRLIKKLLVWLAPLIAFAPIIIGSIGASLTPGCNESNCSWGVIPWYTLYTMQLGVAALVIGLNLKPEPKSVTLPGEKQP